MSNILNSYMGNYTHPCRKGKLRWKEKFNTSSIHTTYSFVYLKLLIMRFLKKVSPSTIDVAHTDLGILKILNTAFFYYSEKIISKRLLKTVQLKCNIAVLTDPFVIWSKVRYLFYFLNHRMKQIWLLLTPCFNLNNRDCLNMTKEN